MKGISTSKKLPDITLSIEDVIYGDIISEKISSHTRWSVWYDIVFKHTNGKVYIGSVERPATEQQEVYQEEVDCYEAEEVEVVVKKWVKKNEKSSILS